MGFYAVKGSNYLPDAHAGDPIFCARLALAARRPNRTDPRGSRRRDPPYLFTSGGNKFRPFIPLDIHVCAGLYNTATNALRQKKSEARRALPKRLPLRLVRARCKYRGRLGFVATNRRSKALR